MKCTSLPLLKRREFITLLGVTHKAEADGLFDQVRVNRTAPMSESTQEE